MPDDHHNVFRDCVRAFVNANYETCSEKSQELWEEHPAFHVGALAVLSLQRLGRFEEAERFGAQFVQAAGRSEWDQNLIGVMVGKLPVARVISQADSAPRRAAALYYEGARLLGEGDTKAAVPWLRASTETGVQTLEDNLARADFQRFIVEPDPDEDVSRLVARSQHLAEQGELVRPLRSPGGPQRWPRTRLANGMWSMRMRSRLSLKSMTSSTTGTRPSRSLPSVARSCTRSSGPRTLSPLKPPRIWPSSSTDGAAGGPPYFEEVVTYYEQARGEDHPDTIDLLKRFAGVTLRAGHPQEAIPMYERVLDHAEQEAWEDHRRRQLLIGLGHARIEVGEFDDAEDVLQQALELEGIDRWSAAQQTAHDHYPLARAALERGDEDRARELIDEGVDQLLAEHPDDAAKVGTTIANVAGNLHSVGFPAFALPYKRQAVEILEDGEDVPRFQLLGALESYAGCLGDVGRHEDAAALYKQVYEAWKEEEGPGHRSTVRARNRWEETRKR